MGLNSYLYRTPYAKVVVARGLLSAAMGRVNGDIAAPISNPANETRYLTSILNALLRFEKAKTDEERVVVTRRYGWARKELVVAGEKYMERIRDAKEQYGPNRERVAGMVEAKGARIQEERRERDYADLHQQSARRTRLFGKR